MQHLYSNDNNSSLPQHETDMYNQSTHVHQHLIHHHVQYSHENPSLSPQQSSTSDADETSNPSPAIINRGINVTVATKIVKKKKQPKKKRKDPNEPQKPVSPYALFFRDTQNDIKKKLANPSFGEISKVVAHMWENIEPEVKEQYKRKAAAAKKEYLKQLAAYRAVQVSHQTPTMHHILNQNPLPFDPNSLQLSHQQKAYAHANPMLNESNTFLSSATTHHHHHHHHQQQQQPPPPQQQQHYHHHPVQHYCQPNIQQQQQQFHNYHYMNTYSHDTTNVYNPETHLQFATHHFEPQTGNYSSYDSNNNYGDQHQYGLLRPAIESELYSSYYSSEHDHSTPTSTTTSSSSSSSSSSTVNENLLHNLNNNNSTNTPHYTDLTSMSNTKPYDYLAHTNDQKDIEHNSLSNENNFHWNQPTCLATQW